MENKIENESINHNNCKSCSEMVINLHSNNDKIYTCQECNRLYLIQTTNLKDNSLKYVNSSNQYLPSISSVNSNDYNFLQEDEYSYKPWNIKKTDTISLQTIYSSNQQNSSSLIPSISIIEQNRYFYVNSKCFHLGGYSSMPGCRFKFTHNQEICLNTVDTEFLIKINISLVDIEYCAVIFHEPVYMMCIKLSDVAAKAFIESLKYMPSFKKNYSYSENDIISNTLVVSIDMKKEEIAPMSRKLSKFFKNIPKTTEFPNKLNFLTLDKSKRLIVDIFSKYLSMK